MTLGLHISRRQYGSNFSYSYFNVTGQQRYQIRLDNAKYHYTVKDHQSYGKNACNLLCVNK